MQFYLNKKILTKRKNGIMRTVVDSNETLTISLNKAASLKGFSSEREYRRKLRAVCFLLSLDAKSFNGIAVSRFTKALKYSMRKCFTQIKLAASFHEAYSKGCIRESDLTFTDEQLNSITEYLTPRQSSDITLLKNCVFDLGSVSLTFEHRKYID